MVGKLPSECWGTFLLHDELKIAETNDVSQILAKLENYTVSVHMQQKNVAKNQQNVARSP